MCELSTRYVPAGQYKHEAAPSLLTVATGQSTQASVPIPPTEEYFPAAQLVHDTDPGVALNFPGVQEVHAEDDDDPTSTL